MNVHFGNNFHKNVFLANLYADFQLLFTANVLPTYMKLKLPILPKPKRKILFYSIIFLKSGRIWSKFKICRASQRCVVGGCS